MSNCIHENYTIDRVCNTCGYDLIVDAQNDKIRQQERERIIKLLQDGAYLCGKGSREYGVRCAWKIADGECRCKDIIALIKGEK